MPVFGFCSGTDKVSILQGCDIMSLGDWCQTFWVSIVVFTSDVKIPVKDIMDFLTLESVTITLPWNVGHQSLNVVALHPTRAEILYLILWNCFFNKLNVIKNGSNFLETVSHKYYSCFKGIIDVCSMGDPVNFQMLSNSFSTLFKVFSLLESGASQILFFVHMYLLPEAGWEVYL